MTNALEAAGVPVTDDAGRVADVHALRHTFITRLARSGVTQKVAQALARHSTITLTMDRYAHVALADTSKAPASLPALPVAAAQPAALAATGTHGRDNAALPPSTRPAPPAANGANVGPQSGPDEAHPVGLRLASSAENRDIESQRRSQRAQVNPGPSMPSHAINAARNQTTTATRSGRRKSRNNGYFATPCQPVPSGVIAAKGSEADGTRTRNHRIDSQPDETRKQRGDAGLREARVAIAAPIAADGFEGPADHDLARVLAAWEDLPGPVRAGILAIVGAATE